MKHTPGPDLDNAELIAAAPELLKVLESFIRAMPPEQSPLFGEDLMNRAREVILKAKGVPTLRAYSQAITMYDRG